MSAAAQAIPGQENVVEAVMTACIAPTRLETGCLFYGLYVDEEKPGRFMFIERWAGKESLRRHAQTRHFQAMVAGPSAVTEGGLDIGKSPA